MSTTDAARDAGLDANSLAETLRGAAFVHFLPAADGDCVAAAGLLAGACGALGVPYQVSVTRTRADREERAAAVDDDATPLPLHREEARPASASAYEAAVALGPDPDPITALAGAVATGADPGAAVPAALDRADLDRRPGLGVPTRDPADGVAYTTLAHLEYSGDPAAAADAIDALDLPSPIDAAGHRRIASLVSLAAAGHGDAPPRAATAVEALLRPYETAAPFATLEGYADVLDTLARAAPGLAVALVLGRDVTGPALDAWRRHARLTHAAVADADLERDGDLAVARIDGPVEPAARLLRDYGTDATAVLVIGDGEAAIAATDDATGRAFASAARSLGADAAAAARTGYARLDPDRADDLAAAVGDAV